MIIVTRLNGPPLGINPDLIERAEETPDTVLTLVDGTKFIVAESVKTVIDRIVHYRANIVATASSLTHAAPVELGVVPHLDTESTGVVAPAVPLRPKGGNDGPR